MDSGTSCMPTDAPIESWTSVASSGDGTRLLAASTSIDSTAEGVVYASTNSGKHWSPVTPIGAAWSLFFSSAASSADGGKLVVVSSNPNTAPASGLIYTTSDYGRTWAPINLACPWLSTAVSADGDSFIAVGWSPRPGGFIPCSCLSSNFGESVWSIA